MSGIKHHLTCVHGTLGALRMLLVDDLMLFGQSKPMRCLVCEIGSFAHRRPRTGLANVPENPAACCQGRP